MAVKYVMMKTRFVYLMAAVLLLFGCNGSKGTGSIDVCGQWELMDITTKAAQIGDVELDVYMDFRQDKTFSLWQKLGEGRHVKYEGTWELTENILTGVYSDGKEWGTSYEVSREGDVLTMSETRTGAESYIYHSCTIPSTLE